MRSDWILDVLADLKTFARANELLALAEQLDDTSIVAMAEIAALRENSIGAHMTASTALEHILGDWSKLTGTQDFRLQLRPYVMK